MRRKIQICPSFLIIIIVIITPLDNLLDRPILYKTGLPIQDILRPLFLFLFNGFINLALELPLLEFNLP